jgi:dihydrofolate reductase
MELAAILAMNKNRVIGNNGSIPWHSSEDLKRFKELTKGCPVIMGRLTWESLPVKPLPQRLNIVVCRYPDKHKIQAETARTLLQAVDKANKLQPNASTVWIIGGAKLFDVALPRLQRIELTLVDDESEGDVKLPPFEHLFTKTNTQTIDANPKLVFITYMSK